MKIHFQTEESGILIGIYFGLHLPLAFAWNYSTQVISILKIHFSIISFIYRLPKISELESLGRGVRFNL